MVYNNQFYIFLMLCVNHEPAGVFPGCQSAGQPPGGAWLIASAEIIANQVLALQVSIIPGSTHDNFHFHFIGQKKSMTTSNIISAKKYNPILCLKGRKMKIVSMGSFYLLHSTNSMNPLSYHRRLVLFCILYRQEY